MNSIIDLHTHSNSSDGTDSPEELLRNIQDKGIKIFALTDHDTTAGVMKLIKIIPEGVRFIRGIEFSCRAENGKCHILGLNYDIESPDFQEALKAGDDLRHKKFHRRIELLREKFNITFTPEEINTLLKIPSVGKPHIANIIVSHGLAENRPEAITKYIDKCRTGNDKISASFAISKILSSGGLPVWAHPLGGEREPELPDDKFRATLEELIYYGLKGLECYYSKYELTKCEYLADTAGHHGLLVSGGSDYHGTNKSIPLGKLNAENIYIDPHKLSILEILTGE